MNRTAIGLNVLGARPFVWALICVVVAILATALAVTVLRDPHSSSRRAYLRQCHEQAFDGGFADTCTSLAQARFGVFNPVLQNLAYSVAAIAVAAGTLFILLYVARQVGGVVRQRG